jgi:hypothetical protein
VVGSEEGDQFPLQTLNTICYCNLPKRRGCWAQQSGAAGSWWLAHGPWFACSGRGGKNQYAHPQYAHPRPSDAPQQPPWAAGTWMLLCNTARLCTNARIRDGVRRQSANTLCSQARLQWIQGQRKTEWLMSGVCVCVCVCVLNSCVCVCVCVCARDTCVGTVHYKG